VVDRYDRFAVLKLYSAGLTPHRADIVDAVRIEAEGLAGVFGRDEIPRDDDEGSRAPGQADEPAPERARGRGKKGQASSAQPAQLVQPAGAGVGRVLWGAEPPERIEYDEHGMKVRVDVRKGQKTGHFLDQRENRRMVRELAPGRAEALNLFSYTGGFSVAAALGGAKHVVSVDTDRDAIALARENFAANGLDPADHAFSTQDCFDILAAYKKEGRRFNLVVCDPPAFAKSQKAVEAALAGYASLNRAALAVLAPGGLLVTASCSARVSPEQFTDAVKEAAFKAKVDLALVGETRQQADHPVSLQFREGRYLKCLVLRRAG
jgi:23S rRNA (cytosine1962-C5)-methyltransferase